jgi:PiT family inorganic phosphate transporter
MLTFGVALIVGLWFIGKEVIQTVGTNLAKMHPASGFSAELAAAGVVMVASTLGLPVSSTHTLVGAVLGIGIVNRNTNWALMKPIGLAWVITLPVAATLSAISFLVLNQIFS